MSDIVMPRLSDSMTEGTVVRWLKQPGDHVARGEPIVEIETDKATITYEADVEGVLQQILVGEGQTVPVGAEIARIGEAAVTPGPPPLAVPAGEQQAPPPSPPPLPLPPDQEPFGAGQTGDFAAAEPAGGEFTAESAIAPLAVPADEQHGRVKASPIARRLARKLGVELAAVEGTGPGGRIVKEDVEAAASAAAEHPPDLQLHAPEEEQVFWEPEPEQPAVPEAPPLQPTGEFEAPPVAPVQPQAPIQPQAPVQPQPQAPAQAPPSVQPIAQQPQQPFPGPPPFVSGMTGGFPAQPPQAPPARQPIVQQPAVPPPGAQQPSAASATRGQVSQVDLSTAQQTVARRMAESKATAPDFFVEMDVDMTNCVTYREQLRAAVSPAPSFNDFVVKAAAQALRQYPRVNAAYKDGRFEQYGDVNIGVVVSAGELLAVPTIFNADQKGVAQIARESQALAQAVRSRSIQPAQLAGGTFTVSNLGMYGVDRFTAILNSPQAAILSVGAITREAVIAEDGMSLVIRQLMTITLTCDHRILYGAEAAEFLGAIKAWLESPQLLPV